MPAVVELVQHGASHVGTVGASAQPLHCGPMAGSQIVVEHRKELSYLLCQAAEIEHMAMCQYLYAAFSLRTDVGPGLTSTQLEAVERWRRAILEIAAEEMLHWSLVNNILTAIGSAPYVSRPEPPAPRQGLPARGAVRAARVRRGGAAPLHLLRTTAGRRRRGRGEFAAEAERPAPMQAGELQPRPQDYVSQGELYRALDDGLEHLERTLGPDLLFIGPPWAQADPSSLSWPALMPVTDLASAKTALVRIIEQGEGGTSRDMASSHYGRFVTILEEYLALPRARTRRSSRRTRSTAAIVRTVEGDAPGGPFITDATTAAVSDLFNVINDLLLQMLCRYFAFGHETSGQSTALVNAVDRDDVRCRRDRWVCCSRRCRSAASIPG